MKKIVKTKISKNKDSHANHKNNNNNDEMIIIATTTKNNSKNKNK